MTLLLLGVVTSTRLVAAEPGLDITQLGVAGVVVAILLWYNQLQRGEIKELRTDLSALSTRSLERMTIVATESSLQMREAAAVLIAAQQSIDRLSGRPELTHEDIFEMRQAIIELRPVIRDLQSFLSRQ